MQNKGVKENNPVERGFTKIAPRRCVAITEPVRAAKSCSDFPLCCVGKGQDFTAPIFAFSNQLPETLLADNLFQKQLVGRGIKRHQNDSM
jgi:hypothetical protein